MSTEVKYSKELSNNMSSTTRGCPAESEQAGRASMCEGCPGQALCKSQGAEDPDQGMIDLRMNAIKHKILVLSGKGGVGKSSIATSLAIALGLDTQKTALLDLDICGPSVPNLMGVAGQQVVSTEYGWKALVSPHGNVKVMSVGSLLESSDSSITFRGPRKTRLIMQLIKDTFWGRLDYLIVDTPPGTSDEHLTVVKALKNTKPDGAVIVTTPQKVALGTIRKEINFCRKMGLKILGIVENMSGYACPCCGEITDIFNSAGSVEKLCEEFKLKYLGKIPLDKHFVMCCEKGQTILKDHPETQTAEALTKLTKTIKETVSS
ncbi:cytosolic Fe-S cluster assembly factor NUBP2 homolog [Lineus longissimus]|uniref:cytosolic Fe-S cluster assembly factor NUBP2 homolog n=1 Tax=Lineus longissimus TaxID=88925 RepID=UPI002B4E2897